MSPTRAAPLHDAFVLRQTNVSNPSVIHRRPSQSSIVASVASENYYSLSASNSSTHSGHSAAATERSSPAHTITRFRTPPSQYRTPQQSSTALAQLENAIEERNVEQVRHTPMRGEGRRRGSANLASGTAGVVAPASTPAQGQLRNGGLRRKPVPSAVMLHDSPASAARISPILAQSSAAQAIDRERDAPTPVDDTPFIHFALDQLTRDEEVRGGREYSGLPGIDSAYPYESPSIPHFPTPPRPQKRHRYEEVSQEEALEEQYDLGQQPQSPINDPISQLDPHDGPQGIPSVQGPDVLTPVSQRESRQPPLDFVPGILRPLALGIFMLILLVYLTCLILAAIWSKAKIGLWAYSSFGDGRYFVFQYLPTMLGMAVLLWLFQVQSAVYRIAPFIAMGPSSSVPSRIVGAKLPLQPRGVLLPYFGHFRARLPVVGSFLLVAWLQIWTIPLLGSSFNVRQERTGQWRWVATQGTIWMVIALYIALIAALALLLMWLQQTITGLRWDPRSLADMMVLLESSNALDGEGETAPQVGYWRTSHCPHEVFHAYGITDKPVRRYRVEDGKLREKSYSDRDTDLEAGHATRYSKESMLPRDENGGSGNRGSALPWFLKPFFALAWPIIAIAALVTFLIVSYLPSTAVRKGFDPMVPSVVNSNGFSGANFLYSFIPTLLAMIVFLGWMHIDLAYRQLAPFESLISINSATSSDLWTGILTGDNVERTLLPSYAADLPVICTLSALFNAHYRTAFLSAITLVSTAIPILASGVLWAQFYVSSQNVRVSAHMPAYYALTVFLAIHTFSYLTLFPSSSLRHARVPGKLDTFVAIRDCLHELRLLDDFAFRDPASKIDLVTKLLSGNVRARIAAHGSSAGTTQIGYARRTNEGAASRVTLADSVRGFGPARVAAAQQTRS